MFKTSQFQTSMPVDGFEVSVQFQKKNEKKQFFSLYLVNEQVLSPTTNFTRLYKSFIISPFTHTIVEDVEIVPKEGEEVWNSDFKVNQLNSSSAMYCLIGVVREEDQKKSECLSFEKSPAFQIMSQELKKLSNLMDNFLEDEEIQFKEGSNDTPIEAFF
jgi:hypothetical protein